jgi:serine/threonine protein kinase
MASPSGLGGAHESRSMLGKLKSLFGEGRTGAPHIGLRHVDLARRYSILAEMPRGSMSRVYKAADLASGRTVCLKVQIKDKNAAAAARTSSQSHDGRPPEGEMAVQVVHPNVVRTYEYGVSTAGEHFLVMEFVDGHTFEYLRETKSGRTFQKVEWLAQAAAGLAAVHAAGFLHHDINPRNFLLDRELHVKLIDFGLSVPNTPAFRRPGNRTGTLQYMAPELIRREAIDERIDIFAFGVVAYEFLTGRLPYDAQNSSAMSRQRLNSEPLDPAVARPQLSEELCQILRQLTARRKEDRLPSLATLPDTLRTIPIKRQRA